ncbi:MAG: ATP-binding protein [Candidatus Bathyarchaeia archaeon]
MVEDNPGDARLIQEMLNEEKFAVGTLEESERLSSGLKRLAKGGIDAILLDLSLPDSQGLNTFETIHSAAKQVPIVIMTAVEDDKLALESVRRGAQDYLVKGKFDSALLVRALNYSVERKKIDDELKRQAELIDLSPDAIIIKKPDDTITFWSLGAEKLYGYTKAQAIGQRTFTLFKTKFLQPQERIQVELKQKGRWSGELVHQTKLGSELAIQSYWLAKFDANHEIVEIFESNVDITERKNAERLAAIGATAGMVGHDIRNPLQTIVGEVFMAKDAVKNLPESSEKESLRESLNTIGEQTTYVDKIVSDLQDYARPLAPKFESTDIQETVRAVIESVCMPENVAFSHKIKDSIKIRTDQSFLQRILTNLVNNAVQAMPDGGQLTITESARNGKAFITVEDTGEGIPTEIRGKMFTPLVTTKAKGQGFGLAVVKRLTDALNGTITVESEVGKGTKFTITLPL